MNYSRIVQCNQRQFEWQLKKEGRTILNYSKKKEEQVLFAKINNTRTSQDKLIIYYAAEGSIKKGDILFFNGNYYVVLNENYHDNDVWHNSVIVKCNTLWRLFGNIIPLVSSELSSPNPRNGSVSSTINGSINFYTKDEPILHEKMSVDDLYYDFGGAYKLVNKFFVDGIAYLYFNRTTLNQNCLPTLKYNEDGYTFSEKGCLDLYYSYEEDPTRIFAPVYQAKYEVTDESIATIDEYGLVTPHKNGSTTVHIITSYQLENGDLLNESYSDESDITVTLTIKDYVEDNNDGGGSDGGDGGGSTPEVLVQTINITADSETIGMNYSKNIYVNITDQNGNKAELVAENFTFTYDVYDTEGNLYKEGITPKAESVTISDDGLDATLTITISKVLSYNGKQLKITCKYNELEGSAFFNLRS